MPDPILTKSKETSEISYFSSNSPAAMPTVASVNYTCVEGSTKSYFNYILFRPDLNYSAIVVKREGGNDEKKYLISNDRDLIDIQYSKIKGLTGQKKFIFFAEKDGKLHEMVRYNEIINNTPCRK